MRDRARVADVRSLSGCNLIDTYVYPPFQCRHNSNILIVWLNCLNSLTIMNHSLEANRRAGGVRVYLIRDRHVDFHLLLSITTTIVLRSFQHVVEWKTILYIVYIRATSLSKISIVKNSPAERWSASYWQLWWVQAWQLWFLVYTSFCQRLSYDQFQTPCVFCLSLFHETQRPSCTILIQLCVSLGYDPCLVVLLSRLCPYLCASYLSSWFQANITVFLILYSTFWIWRLYDFICG